MTTTVAKTIGTGGDYSLPQLWEDAAPVDLTAVDQIWQGQCKNQAFTSAVNLLTVGGTADDATRYVELTTQAGASFMDDAGAATNPLRADTTKGASFTLTGDYDATLTAGSSTPYFRLSKLQLISAATHRETLHIGSLTLFTMDNCIVETGNGDGDRIQANNVLMRNCLWIGTNSSKPSIVSMFLTFTFINCTFVVPSDKTAASAAIDLNYSSGTVVKNCAFFGFTNVHVLHGGSSAPTYTTCATDVASPPSGCTTRAYDTTTGSGFEGITLAARDFRIKGTSALKDAGTNDATNTPNDIIGLPRTAWDIGAWEVQPASVTSSPGTGSITFAGLMPISRIDIPVYGSLGQFDPQLRVEAWF